jgi:Leucine-rich repeat (LRR) protein
LGAFNGLTELTHLFISDNKIIEIMPGTRENMSSLEFLDLSHNKLKHLNSDTFSGLGAFNGLTKLTEVSMSHNEISEILRDTFENMSSLEYLYLIDNRIKHLNSAMFRGLGAFNGLTELTHLSIEYNDISEIMPGKFENINSLENLDLSYNTIEHLVLCSVGWLN